MDGALMVEDLRLLVECESPSDDIEATTRCADVVAGLGQERMGMSPERTVVNGRTHLLWTFGDGPVRQLVVGHFDTVWPMGTLARWPFSVEGDRATGPGCFDMKAGIVQAMHAIASLGQDAAERGVGLLLTSDEEIGSFDSRALIQEVAASAEAVYVPEASKDGALKSARKGVSLYDLHVQGRAAHAGLEPHKGINATIELAHQLLVIADLGDAELGTTVTPSVARAGTTSNTVAAEAQVRLDVRCATVAEQERVDEALQALTPVLEGASLRLEGGVNRPVFEEEVSAGIVARAQRLYRELGFGELGAAPVGGASDGNFTAAMGIPTLDGVGAVGDGAHAEGEWVSVPDLPKQAALLAALLADDG